MFFENPKSKARVKYWRAPSSSRAAEQLLAPDETQLLAELRPNEVLAPFTPGERQVGGFGALSPDQHREQLGVFVVGMGRDHQRALGMTQHPLGLAKRHRSAGGRPQGLLRRQRDRSEKRQGQRQCEPHAPGLGSSSP